MQVDRFLVSACLLVYLFTCYHFHRIRSHPLDLSGQFGGGEGELATHRGGQVDHLDAPTFQTDLV